jgi:cytochrome c-type biogenesis protein CcmE
VKAKYIVGIIIIAVFAGWGATSFMTTTISYVSIDEVTKTDGTVQLMGKIDFDAVDYDAENSRLVFEVTGLEDHTRNKRLTIVYTGVVPGNFDQATSVVAKGHYQDGVFLADQLLVKCPSKYQGLEEKA